MFFSLFNILTLKILTFKINKNPKYLYDHLKLEKQDEV